MLPRLINYLEPLVERFVAKQDGGAEDTAVVDFVRGHTVVRRCFAADATRVVMPAFGAYTGGLSIRDRAFAAVFGAGDFTAHVLGQRRIFAFSAAHCV